MVGNRYISGFQLMLRFLASFGDLGGTARKDSGRLIRLAGRREFVQLGMCGIL